jgi:hypothetical protein
MPTHSERIDAPRAGDRVRHVNTGELGELGELASFTPLKVWALVRWDISGPGMRDPDGLSYVELGLLERVEPGPPNTPGDHDMPTL